MKKRVQAGTDIAKIGAWDAGRNDPALVKVSMKKLDQAWEEDAAAGRLFFIRTGADGGGPIDVYIDADVPEDVRKKFKAVDREFLLSSPTGRLRIGGVEDYRSGKEGDANGSDVIEIPAGNYSLRCSIAEEEETGVAAPSRTKLEETVGTADYNYYVRLQRVAMTAYFGVPFLFAVLCFTRGWKQALLIAGVAGVVSFLSIKWWTSGNARFKRVAEAVNMLWREELERATPIFIFELRRKENITGLKGGSFRL